MVNMVFITISLHTIFLETSQRENFWTHFFFPFSAFIFNENERILLMETTCMRFFFRLRHFLFSVKSVDSDLSGINKFSLDVSISFSHQHTKRQVKLLGNRTKNKTLVQYWNWHFFGKFNWHLLSSINNLEIEWMHLSFRKLEIENYWKIIWYIFQ